MSQAEAFAVNVAESFLALIEGQDLEDFMAENGLFKHMQDNDLKLTICIDGRGGIEMEVSPIEGEDEEISDEHVEYELSLMGSMMTKFNRFAQIMVMLFGEQAHNIPVGEHVFAAIFSPEEMELFHRLF